MSDDIEIEDPNNVLVVLGAWKFAAEAHEGQTRDVGPDKTEPYVYHCKRVAGMVQRLGGTNEMVAAAFLHDVLEDTEATYNQLASAFGPLVAEMVLSLTDHYTPGRYPKFNRSIRKTYEANALALRSWQVRLIKLCDVLDNDVAIEAKGGGFAEVWRAERDYLVPLLMKGDHRGGTDE